MNDVDSSYYNTKFKLFDNDEINTKLLRFRINNLRDIKLSQNAKLILESIYLPTVIDDASDIKHNSNIVVRLKILVIRIVLTAQKIIIVHLSFFSFCSIKTTNNYKHCNNDTGCCNKYYYI